MKKNLIRAMAISGAFAGLAGGLDMLGYLYRFGVSDIPVVGRRLPRHRRRAARPQHRRRRRARRLLFGALLFGTTHGSQSGAIDPQLAGNLTYMIQGLIVLFVGADVLILYVWNTRRTPAAEDGAVTRSSAWRGGAVAGCAAAAAGARDRRRRARRRSPCFLTIPPIEARAIVWPILVGILAAAFGIWAVDARRAPARHGARSRRA